MYRKTLSELAAELQKGQISSLELTRLFLDRIEASNTSLNAFISVDREGAEQAAKAADALLAQGQTGPLLGLPLAHKDIFCTEGVKTSISATSGISFTFRPWDRLAEGGIPPTRASSCCSASSI